MANATTVSDSDASFREKGERPPGHGSGKPGSSGSGGGGGKPVATNFFDPYKPGQGVKVRWYSLGAALLMSAGAAQFMYQQMLLPWMDPARAWTRFLVYGLTVVVVAVLGLLSYWFTFRNRQSSDFLIATEGEMRKVNWSTRREVIGSTKVVIAFTLLFGIMMGVVDLVFFKLFQAIGVLKEGVAGLGDPGG